MKICKLCGLPYDEELFRQIAKRQMPSRTNTGNYYAVSKYCGLWCSWLSQPANTLTENRVSKMQNEIAIRVANYLYKKIKRAK